MFQCDKCGCFSFNIQDENGISIIKCLNCGKIIGAVQTYNPEEDINQIKNMINESYENIANVLGKIINNQSVINQKISK